MISLEEAKNIFANNVKVEEEKKLKHIEDCKIYLEKHFIDQINSAIHLPFDFYVVHKLTHTQVLHSDALLVDEKLTEEFITNIKSLNFVVHKQKTFSDGNYYSHYKISW